MRIVANCRTTISHCLLLALIGCGESTAPLEPAPIPLAADLRFKGIGTTSPQQASVLGNHVANNAVVYFNQRGTPLDIEPCPPPSPGGSNCGWELALFSEPVGTPDVNTVYNSTGSLATLQSDLTALQHGSLISFGVDLTSVITSLFIDARSNVYATSGLQSSDVHDFGLVFGSVSLGALQSAAAQAGSQGRVITALDFNGGNVQYLSYGWSRDPNTAYDAKVVVAPFNNVASMATSLASEGYMITAVGGNLVDGFLLVGTRVSGQASPRPLLIVTDSVRLPPPSFAQNALSGAGYAIVGTILGNHPGDSHLFSIYIGEK
ncbi:MAG: hypothetical protein ABJF01_19990 [bacterium]